VTDVADPPGKARHSTLMLLSAALISDQLPDLIQRRAMARYVFLYGDAALLWCQRWRTILKRDRATERHALAARPAVAELAAAVADADGVRDYLAAKRQSLAGMRADDIEATSRLWGSVTPAKAGRIVTAAVAAYDALAGKGSVVDTLAWDSATVAGLTTSVSARDPAHWYVASDTGADQRPHTLVAAQGGELGRLIAQINDVVEHLRVLIAVAPVLYGQLPFDWLVRSALMVELSALHDLVLGPPPGEKRTVTFSLLDRCRASERTREAGEELVRLRESIISGPEYVRFARNKFGAHFDARMTTVELHRHLAELDFEGNLRFAAHLIDWLDGLGATQLDLQLLALGERRISTWKTDPAHPPRGAPSAAGSPGALADMFRRFDSPYMAVTNSSMGSAVLGGIMAGRRPEPIKRRPVPRRLDELTQPMPRLSDAAIAQVLAAAGSSRP
jgi:hypothetical protein